MRAPWLGMVLLALVASALPAQQADSALQRADSALPRPPRPPKSSSTLITEDEIDKARGTVGNALDVVRLLRPRWLRQRTPLLSPNEGGSLRMQDFHVYLDDHEMGGLNFLQALPADQIYTLRFLSVAEVGARYGPSSGPGIVVTLRH
jgi:hypothetical protein